jgi:hypothetical protein
VVEPDPLHSPVCRDEGQTAVSDDLLPLLRKIESLDAGVGDIRDRLLNCLHAAERRPADALALARGIGEVLAKQILTAIDIKPPRMLDACLRELEKPQMMSRGLVPGEIITMLHKVRTIGNKALHDDLRIEVSLDDVTSVLGDVLRVTRWYFREFTRGPRLEEKQRLKQEQERQEAERRRREAEEAKQRLKQEQERQESERRRREAEEAKQRREAPIPIWSYPILVLLTPVLLAYGIVTNKHIMRVLILGALAVMVNMVSESWKFDPHRDHNLGPFVILLLIPPVLLFLRDKLGTVLATLAFAIPAVLCLIDSIVCLYKELRKP